MCDNKCNQTPQTTQIIMYHHLFILSFPFILSSAIPSHVFDDIENNQWVPPYSKIEEVKKGTERHTHGPREFLLSRGTIKSTGTDDWVEEDEEEDIVPILEDKDDPKMFINHREISSHQDSNVQSDAKVINDNKVVFQDDESKFLKQRKERMYEHDA
jgi:hypothetical protein